MTATEALHRAAQYLCTAAISFVPKQDDDSHTNLGWNSDEAVLVTRPLNSEGLRLELNHQVYALDIVHPESGLSGSFPLTGARHLDVLKWLDNEREFCGISKPYTFDLHYELGYSPRLDDHFTFPSIVGEALDAEIERRNIADRAMKAILLEYGTAELPRIWPHHFDSGALIQHPTPKISSIGIGMAIPDGMIDDHYLYVSGYDSGGGLSTDTLRALPSGEWYGDGWKGAAVSMTGLTAEEALAFYRNAIKAYVDLP
ncbi:MAG: hypothetical protein HQ500_05550 [Flavobacteriales bacterium]|nr:hypothetical protein [Flavobacteriales bacterium]